MPYAIERSDSEWRKILTPEQYRVLREAGTERPGTGAYLETSDDGVYRCAGWGNALFRSNAKYHSGRGWPSFYEPIAPGAVVEIADTSHGMVRTEIRCGSCGSHLGHVFDDGPQPTGERYCMNSVALDFKPGGE